MLKEICEGDLTWAGKATADDRPHVIAHIYQPTLIVSAIRQPA